MEYVYVLDKNGSPLMPTSRCGKVRRLLKNGEAKVVRKEPFTIQLLKETTSHVQPISLGVDTGASLYKDARQLKSISETKGNHYSLSSLKEWTFSEEWA